MFFEKSVLLRKSRKKSTLACIHTKIYVVYPKLGFHILEIVTNL